ncbi:MAG: hypothetical protein PHP31_07010 [Lentimicrobiaceae bacterium]|nr:hypothetical protein [Lentimicrobiaceae bacterium]
MKEQEDRNIITVQKETLLNIPKYYDYLRADREDDVCPISSSKIIKSINIIRTEKPKNVKQNR